VDASIGVNENAFGGEALGAVTDDGVAVVEVTMLAGVELDLAVVVEACREPTFRVRLLVGAHNLLIPAQPEFPICAVLS